MLAGMPRWVPLPAPLNYDRLDGPVTCCLHLMQAEACSGGGGDALQGELIYKVVSYTPYPCQSDVKGERIRIDVGPVGSREPRCAALA